MGSKVNNIQSLLLQAQSELESAKDSKAQAKASASKSYQTSAKIYRLSNGKLGNVYDNRIDNAQQAVKKYKAQLAEAKKEAKKK